MNPTISIIIPNYNHGHLISRCLDSELNQSVLPDEIIIIDDASTDNSLEVIKTYTDKYPFIKLLSSLNNSGPHTAMNRGLQIANGDYIGFHAADDVVKPEIYNLFKKALQLYSNAGVCSGVCECVANDLKWLVGSKMPSHKIFFSPFNMTQLKGKLSISGSSIIKTSVARELGGYRKELKWFADWFICYVAAFKYGMCHVPEVVSTSYMYSDSYYHSSSKERIAVLSTLLELLPPISLIYESGKLGDFGWPMLYLAFTKSKNWKTINPTMLIMSIKRCCEILGRKLFPAWLAKLCIERLYMEKEHPIRMEKIVCNSCRKECEIPFEVFAVHHNDGLAHYCDNCMENSPHTHVEGWKKELC